MKNLDSNLYDICVIGGGVNGCGIARDAAGRGYKTLLLEQADLAAATSSKSTKLIHGGLRYLEQYEFRLVRESLQERNRLINIAPHIIWPLDFILPHEPHIRPYPLIRLGLYIYDLLGLSRTNKYFHRSYGVKLSHSKFGNHLKNKTGKALCYSDGWVDDARLVALNARDAAHKGATILSYTPCTSISPQNGAWYIETKDIIYQSKVIVNAAGPWVRSLLNQNNLDTIDTPRTKLVQGSHIILPQLYDGDHAYILQQTDKRIVFAIPYEDKFTLIGTTETPFTGNPLGAKISDDETNYLITIVNNYFENQMTKNDIIQSYSGVRPLYDEASTADARTTTRDYKITIDTHDTAPILSIFGGKITTYRALSEHVMQHIDEIFKQKTKIWTALSPLPGGTQNPEMVLNILIQNYPTLCQKMLTRMVYAYGTETEIFLKINHENFICDGVLKSEIDFTIQNEFVKTGDDFLWRRSKLSLHIAPEDQKKISDYIEAYHA